MKFPACAVLKLWKQAMYISSFIIFQPITISENVQYIIYIYQFLYLGEREKRFNFCRFWLKHELGIKSTLKQHRCRTAEKYIEYSNLMPQGSNGYMKTPSKGSLSWHISTHHITAKAKKYSPLQTISKHLP